MANVLLNFVSLLLLYASHAGSSTGEAIAFSLATI